MLALVRIGVLEHLKGLNCASCVGSYISITSTSLAALHTDLADEQHQQYAPSTCQRWRHQHYCHMQQQQQLLAWSGSCWHSSTQQAVTAISSSGTAGRSFSCTIGGGASLGSLQRQRHAWLRRCYHTPLEQQQPAPSPLNQQQQQQQHKQGSRLAGSSFTSLPNLLSLSRIVSGPWVAWLIAHQQWPLAVALTAAAGATDWADGFLARRLGHTSKLGSYLDPLADKLFIGCIVGTMGVMGLLPGWLAVLVVGRDAAQVAGTAVYRLRMFGGRWPGAAAYFDVDSGAATGSSSSGGSWGRASPEPGAAEGAAAAGGGLPAVRPLLVSKVNTALVLVLVAGCMTQQWQGLPGQELLDALELATATTTSASAVAYAWLHHKGELLSHSNGSSSSGRV